MSLDGIYDRANIFAKIIRGEMPAVKIHEDATTLSFMDIFPESKGHCLVIPKNTEARNLTDFDPARLGPYFHRVQLITRAVIKGLKPDGVQVKQFNGAPSGQTIFHLHVHVVPCWEGTPLQRHAGKMADMDELKALATKIAAAL